MICMMGSIVIIYFHLICGFDSITWIVMIYELMFYLVFSWVLLVVAWGWELTLGFLLDLLVDVGWF